MHASCNLVPVAADGGFRGIPSPTNLGTIHALIAKQPAQIGRINAGGDRHLTRRELVILGCALAGIQPERQSGVDGLSDQRH